MSDKQRQPWSTARAYGIGFELVCAVAGFTVIGFWIDRHFNSRPWGTLIGLALGCIGGFYNLLRDTSRAFGRGEERRLPAPGAPAAGANGSPPAGADKRADGDRAGRS
ncbi:MAG TPA: AtpZ/AtpI family protein [Thermoanaerobaculia bacterium]|nr:AtpZ/AtpI family protein [Thermoanaerobaculia bacterium]